MATVTIKLGAMSAAYRQLGTLADDIEQARTTIRQAIPYRVSTPSLNYGGATTTVPTWLREQRDDPIGVVRDLARLLDEGDGSETVTVTTTGDTMESIREQLGVLIATGLANVGQNDRAGMQNYADLMARYGDNAEVMGAILDELGPDGTEAVLDHAAELEVDLAPSFGEEGQKIIAGWVADDIQDKKIDGQTTSFLAHFDDQEHFSTALFTTVSPDEFGDAILHLSQDVYPPGSMSTPDPAQAQIYADFLDHAGVSLATYSNHVANPAALADEWYNAITGNGTDDLNQHPNPENAAALTLLIKRGGQHAEFDATFLGDLTNQVYDWERSFGGDAVWGPLNDQFSPGYGVKEPIIEYGDTTTSADNITYPGTPFDGLANLLSGMEMSPEAAERFFTYEGDGTYVDQVEYKGEHVNEKLLYLFADRKWPTDDGDGFGVALRNAATHSRDEGDGSPDSLTKGDRAARLASQSVFIIANETGRGDSWKDDGWQIPAGMRDDVGYMLAAYAPDIHRISQAEGDDISGNNWVFGDHDSENGYHGFMGLAASSEDLATVLQGVGRGDDKEGITAVLTSQIAHHESLMNDALTAYNERHPDAPKTIDEIMSDQNFNQALVTIGETNGGTLEFILSNGVAGGRDDENARKERAEMMATAFSIGTSFLPGAGEVLGEGATELAKKTYGVVTSQAIGELKKRIGAAPDGLTDAWGASSEDDIRTGLSYGTYNAFLNAGYLDPDVDPEHGIPPGAITAPNENGMIFINPALYDGLSNEDDVPVDVRNEFHAWLINTDGGAPHSAVAPMLNGYSNKVNSWISG